MTRLAWITDPHFSCADNDVIPALGDTLRQGGAEGVLITGDLAEANNIVQYLDMLAMHWPRPVYFVLGNHDYYFGSIRATRRLVADWCADHAGYHYLTGAAPIALSSEVALIGDDGWADARLGDYDRSMVSMNDFRLIDELKPLDHRTRGEALARLGDESAARLRPRLEEAVVAYPVTLLITHVPPFQEACWHNGQISDHHWLPHFTCHAVGRLLRRVMERHPQRRLEVLCGHTHGGGTCWPLPNLRVLTGDAEYGQPRIHRWIETVDLA